MGILDGYIKASEHPTILVDASLKKNFSSDKLLAAEKRAKELVNELPYNKKEISLYLKKAFDFELKEWISFSLGIRGKKREISLIVTFVDDTPIYKISAISGPDFVMAEKKKSDKKKKKS